MISNLLRSLTNCILQLNLSREQLAGYVYVLRPLLHVRIAAAVKVARSKRLALELNSGIEFVEVTGTENMKSAVHEPEIGIVWP